MVPEQRVKTCTYQVCHIVKECHTKEIPYQVCQMVPETCVKQVPYTVCKPVCYTKTINCWKLVPKCVPYTVTRCVPVVVCKQVPVTVCCPVPALLPVELLRRNEGLRSGGLRQRLSTLLSSPGGREVWSSENGGSTPQSRAAVVSWAAGTYSSRSAVRETPSLPGLLALDRRQR